VRGVAHRFPLPDRVPVGWDVSREGPRREDALVPLSFRLGGSHKMGLKDVFAMIVHAEDVKASRPAGKVGRAIMSGIGRFIRLFGVKPLARADGW